MTTLILNDGLGSVRIADEDVSALLNFIKTVDSRPVITGINMVLAGSNKSPRVPVLSPAAKRKLGVRTRLPAACEANRLATLLRLSPSEAGAAAAMLLLELAKSGSSRVYLDDIWQATHHHGKIKDGWAKAVGKMVRRSLCMLQLDAELCAPDSGIEVEDGKPRRWYEIGEAAQAALLAPAQMNGG